MYRAVSFAAAVLACACLAPALAQAAPVTSQLRAEAATRPLAVGSFVTDTTSVQTDRSGSCGGSGKTATMRGPTALGLVASGGSVFAGVRPLRVSDKFGFGLFVCGIGAFTGDANAFWLYKVDHVAPEVGAEQFALKGGEQVLWYFSDTSRNVNTGDELELAAPARARPGRPFQVTVYAYDSAGKRTPAAKARVFGAAVQTTDANGRATISTAREGALRLRAVRGPDVPSAPLRVCVRAVLSRCPVVRGQRIYGTAAGDRIQGTAGPDVIEARDGNDRIDVRDTGRDRVRCGRGFDSVVGTLDDRFARDCERRAAVG